jgi:tetratricopeptide (TPR) repeat protein
MKAEKPIKAEENGKFGSLKRHLIFFLVLLALVGSTIIRSGLATRLDSFTFDEAYHIGAGAAYVQTGDFRLNPEHPPLVKLWTGAFVSDVCRISPYRAFQDKGDERAFVEEDVYLGNDADRIQTRARAAMFALNSLLLFLFALAVRRLLGDVMALGATLFLAIDPTVAAHFPVVMTDLPVALASSTAVLLAVGAFRSWRAVDAVLAALALGLALSAKHSAVITMIAVAVIGLASAIFFAGGAKISLRLRRAGFVALVLIGALVVLWSFYLFRFAESPGTAAEQFNRPLGDKISDVKSPVYRAGLNLMTQGRLFPRAYIWGMADTIRAGAEGRVDSVLAFGSLYYGKAPFYYFPGVIMVKLPLGLLLLTVAGAFFLIARRLPREFAAPLAGTIVLSALFLTALIKGSSYGGIRHALPIVPTLALLAAVAIYKALEARSYLLRGTLALALVAALISAVPVVRPWEYFNETVGTENAYLYFDDEGIDLGLRSKEVVEYYNRHLKPAGEVPYVLYFAPYIELKKRGLDYVGRDDERDREQLKSEVATGTFILGAQELSPSLWWDKKDFRDATPVARFGNIFVYRGTFRTSDLGAGELYYSAIGKIYTENPQTGQAIEMLSEVVARDPRAFFAALELGNQYLKTGRREEALRAYRLAREHAPASDETGELLRRQIERVEREPLEQIQPLRNPGLE